MTYKRKCGQKYFADAEWEVAVVSEQEKNKTEVNQPHITRSEYLRLLLAARQAGRERTYLLIKLFACTGIKIYHLPKLTVEAVRENKIYLNSSTLHIPDILRKELLEYAQRKEIFSGEIFRTRSGARLDRSNLTHQIQAFSHEAQVAPEKCTPRCLRRLYLESRAGYMENIENLVEQALDQMIASEQIAIGWNSS